MTDSSNPYTAPKSSIEPGSGQTMISCKGCSKEIHKFASACPHCGLLQRSRPYKNKNLAGLFAMLFGAFGVHRFFLGQWWGVFYLLTFWTGIPSIISFFEAFVFWFSNVQKWDAKYNEAKPASPTEQSGAGTIIIISVVVLFVGVAILGILAAIAIPAYQDYTVRAKVNQALVEASPHKIDIQLYYEENDSMPSSNAEIGIQNNVLPSGHTFELSQKGFTITYDSVDQIDGLTIEFEAYLDQGLFAWDCTGGTLLNRHRPSICRSSETSTRSD